MGNCAEPGVHYVLKTPYKETPPNAHVAYFASGCFWGSEELMWKTPGVLSTAVGYQGGKTDNPTYRDICTGRTNHAEGVRVVYDPAKVAYTDLLRAFWQSHDPTQGNRQGNDAGTQYRSAIFAENPEHLRLAELSKAAYEEALAAKGYGKITTEIAPAEGRPFYFAEEEHQQYLAKPGSRQYCSAQPTGVPLPDASKWLPKELEHHAPKLDDVPASRCAKGKCSL